VWRAVHDAGTAQGEQPDSLTRVRHRTVKGVTEDLERYRFNTAISKLMVLTNEIRRILDAGHAAREAASALVQMLAPLAPFIAEELWCEVLGGESSVHASGWPAFDPDLAREETVTLVVQVDGKVRDRIGIESDAEEERCKEVALASERVRRALGNRTIERTIVRPPKLVSLVTARS